MKRRIFTIVSALSLAMWLTVAMLFVRSFWVAADWNRCHRDGPGVTEMRVWSCGGRVHGSWWRKVPLDPQWLDAYRDTPMDRWHHVGWSVSLAQGTEWYRPSYDLRWQQSYLTPLCKVTQSLVQVSIPYWVLLLLLSIPPAHWLRRFRRLHRRQKLGLCLECGYDLRAHVPGQLCPECGWSIPADFPRPNSGAVEQAKDGRDIPPQT